MKLLVGFLGQKASTNWVQLGHRKTAIEYALAGIRQVGRANKRLFRRDKLFSDLEGVMQDWVAETLYQGAYLREYHLWEKDCKAYFAAMAVRNKDSWSAKVKGDTAFPGHIAATLLTYGVRLPEGVFAEIDTMRKRVNVMKHDSGLELEHFITKGDYQQAIGALKQFWELLAAEESYNPDST